MKNSCLSLVAAVFLISCNQQPKSATRLSTNYDSLRVVLERMRANDQEIRRILVDSIGFDSPHAGPFIKKMMDIDRENQKNIKLILETYGWIPRSKIGKEAADAFFFTVQHTDLELMEIWFPEFKKLAAAGEANPQHAAMMEDRLLMWQGKKQMYGTQAADFRPDKKMAIWPIENPKEVNARRKQVGFTTTIEEYAASMDAIYNENEQLPDNKR
jgi:hypothetical protein